MVLEEVEEFQVCESAAGVTAAQRLQPPTLLLSQLEACAQLSRLRSLTSTVLSLQPLEKLEALGVNKGDIKKARDAGASAGRALAAGGGA